MKKLFLSFGVAMVLAMVPASAAVRTDDSGVSPLSNKDIVVMIEQKLETEAIIKVIRSSPCTFDTFPPVLRELKRRGVPDAVLTAMLEAPYGPSVQSSSKDDLGEQPIYHYAEQLKQMGFLTPSVSGRGFQTTRQSRARASRSRQRM